MGRKRKYYCDFCNRYFNDNMDMRNRHSKSALHLTIKKEHYNMFRDPEVIIIEEAAKSPCRDFRRKGYCPYGGLCFFSHYSQDDLEAIKTEISLRKRRELSNIPTLDPWLHKYYQDFNEKQLNASKLMWSCELPYDFKMNPSLLPPSLLPFNIKDFIDAEIESWG